jgi:type I restriction-modification system DNA methylase subunit
MSESAIVSKVWNFANVLRDDGVGYGYYLEQITYLLFLKMADELNKPPYSKGLKFPKLKNAQGEELPMPKPATGKPFRKKEVWNWRISTAKCCAVWVVKKARWDKYSSRVKTKSKTLPNY